MFVHNDGINITVFRLFGRHLPPKTSPTLSNSTYSRIDLTWVLAQACIFCLKGPTITTVWSCSECYLEIYPSLSPGMPVYPTLAGMESRKVTPRVRHMEM